MPKRVEAGPATVVTTNQVRYDDIDTLGGNSGSGILGPAGELVGVHTNGGCNAAGTGSNFGTAIAGIRAVSPTLQALPHGARTATADDGFTSLAQDVIATVRAADQVGTLLGADTARAVDVLTIRQADSHTVADQIATSFLRDQGGTPRALDSVFQGDTRFAADNPVGTGIAGDVGTGPGDTLQEGVFDPGDLFDPVVNPAIGRLVQAGALAGARPFVQGAESLVDEEGPGEAVDVVGALVEAVADARATSRPSRRRSPSSRPGSDSGDLAHGPDRETAMIGIVSHADDLHTTEVVRHLTRSARPVLLDTGHAPRDVALTSTQDAAGWRADWVDTSAEGVSAVDTTTLRAVVVAPPQPFALHDDLRSAQDRGFAHGEVAAAVSGLWSCLPATWVNDPDRDEAGSRKMWQLQVAARLGLRVPRTCMTNDPARAREFLHREPGRVIFKPFSGTPATWRETRPVREADLALIESVRYAPVIFQEAVAGRTCA